MRLERKLGSALPLALAAIVFGGWGPLPPGAPHAPISGTYVGGGLWSLPTDEFFVRWQPQVPFADREATYRAHGLRPVWRSSLVPGLERVQAPAGVVPMAVRLSGVRGVLYVQPNFRFHRELPRPPAPGVAPGFVDGPAPSPQFPNDPLVKQQWALTNENGIHPVEAWAKTQGSRDVRVAVIDTGVDPKSTELSDRLAPGFDFIDKTAEVYDHHGHGTHVSGVIGAKTNNAFGIAGINPNVTIIPIRAVPSNGDESDADVIAAFEFAVKAGARVANCSFGKPQASQAVGDTIAAAGQHGLLAIVAAGNDGNDLNTHPAYPASFRTPNMIVVAASTARGDLARFSNYGMGKVDLAAPGAGILSTLPGDKFASWSGTSMATPQVVGVAALALSANPRLDVLSLRKIILDSATRDRVLAGKVDTSGRVSAADAVRLAASVPPVARLGWPAVGFPR